MRDERQRGSWEWLHRTRSAFVDVESSDGVLLRSCF